MGTTVRGRGDSGPQGEPKASWDEARDGGDISVEMQPTKDRHTQGVRQHVRGHGVGHRPGLPCGAGAPAQLLADLSRVDQEGHHEA